MGILTYHRSSRSEWRKVFFLAAVVYTVGAIVFVIFGSGERQSWAGTAADDNRKEELKIFTESVQTTDNKQSDDSADVQQSIELWNKDNLLYGYADLAAGSDRVYCCVCFWHIGVFSEVRRYRLRLVAGTFQYYTTY